MEWAEVRKEMVEEKGLAEDVADKIGNYVKLHGGIDLLDQLSSDPTLIAVKDAKVGLDEMKLLLSYCELFGVLDRVSYVGVALGVALGVVRIHFCSSSDMSNIYTRVQS